MRKLERKACGSPPSRDRGRTRASPDSTLTKWTRPSAPSAYPQTACPATHLSWVLRSQRWTRDGSGQPPAASQAQLRGKRARGGMKWLPPRKSAVGAIEMGAAVRMKTQLKSQRTSKFSKLELKSEDTTMSCASCVCQWVISPLWVPASCLVVCLIHIVVMNFICFNNSRHNWLSHI